MRSGKTKTVLNSPSKEREASKLLPALEVKPRNVLILPLNDAVINNPVVFTADFSGGTRRGRRVPLHYNVIP